MNTSTSTSLRPSSMDILDLFEAAYRLYIKHALTFIGIVAILQIPMMMLQSLIEIMFTGPAMLQLIDFVLGKPLNQNTTLTQSAITFFSTMGIFMMMQSFIIQYVITCGLVNATACSLRNQPFTILSAYRLNVWRFVSSILANLVTWLIVFLPSIIFIICWTGISMLLIYIFGNNSVLEMITGGGLVVGPIILLFPSMILFFVRFQLASQAIVLENKGTLGGLRRSWQLIGGSFWKVFALVSIMGVTSFIASIIPAEFIGTILGFVRNNSEQRVWQQVITSLLSGIGYSLWMPLQVITYTLLYKNLEEQYKF